MPRLSSSIIQTPDSFFVVVMAGDKELAEMIQENVNKLYVDHCSKCDKFFIVNSSNHTICRRCK